MGFNDVSVQDVARCGVGTELGLEETGVVGLDREQEDRSRGAVDDERGIGITDFLRTGGACEGGLDGGPRLTAVLGDAEDDGVGLGRVLAGVRAPVPRGDDPAVVGGGQRADAVAAKAGQAGGREANFLADRVVMRDLQRVRGWRTLTLGDGRGWRPTWSSM